jgi:hypothetical protein
LTHREAIELAKRLAVADGALDGDDIRRLVITVLVHTGEVY